MKQIIFKIETQEDFSSNEIQNLTEIIQALIDTGGLSGMKNGSTNIHFDQNGLFQGVQFTYWPWKRRKKV